MELVERSCREPTLLPGLEIRLAACRSRVSYLMSSWPFRESDFRTFDFFNRHGRRPGKIWPKLAGGSS